MTCHRSILALVALFVYACSVDSTSMTVPPGSDDQPSETDTDGGVIFVPADLATGEDAGSCPDMFISGSRACGKCGVASISCVAGKEVVGACMNETGVCVPGDTVYTAAGCQMRTCDGTCKWPAWKLKPGAQCSGESTCYAGPGCPHAGTLTCVKCMIGACVCR